MEFIFPLLKGRHFAPYGYFSPLFSSLSFVPFGQSFFLIARWIAWQQEEGVSWIALRKDDWNNFGTNVIVMWISTRDRSFFFDKWMNLSTIVRWVNLCFRYLRNNSQIVLSLDLGSKRIWKNLFHLFLEEEKSIYTEIKVISRNCIVYRSEYLRKYIKITFSFL